MGGRGGGGGVRASVGVRVVVGVRCKIEKCGGWRGEEGG